ncbi:MAG: alanine--tRNA ligase, partial [Lentisphaeria bacterium]|nr:alanine--tRNA ligase [Lentisphaeria bacterium]
WSLGDYFKVESIGYSFDFLTNERWLNIPLDRLAFTVFAGDEDAPFDEEAFNEWRKHGVSEKRIAKLPKKDNWWGPAGETGPCGPDTEIFYWTGPQPTPEVFDPSDKRWVEIWNNVFMQYFKNAEGKFEPLKQQNVDTGMGVERVTAILQGKASCYDTEIFAPLFAKLDELRGIETPAERTRSERIIVEHMRAATFIMGDGVTPGKVDQAYVLRRIIRRAIREAMKLELNKSFTVAMAQVVIDNYKDVYSELAINEKIILEEFEREERQFASALDRGTREFEKLIARVPAHIERKVISGKNAFNLYETYGFPIELTVEMAAEKGFTVDMEGYQKAFEKHQELSRQGAEQKFKGGLADHSDETARLHTATHMLHKALRIVLGDHVAQKGSNITAERLRFDFSHPDKMTPEQIAEVQKIVNEQIQRELPVICEEMTVDEARAAGAIGLFGDKYGERVKVYSIGDYSKEICGGPHAQNSKDLGEFIIQKEESSSRGVRRIKAIIKH